MAIQVNGTTVIDDSRNLSNVGGLKTINSTSILGSGDISAGASTTLGAVATYGFFRSSSGDSDPGATTSGSLLWWSDSNDVYNSSPTPSGTWRAMGHHSRSGNSSLFVRIS